MIDSRICKPLIGVGPAIGSETQTDSRICKAVINVGPEIGDGGIIISYGSSGSIGYGSSGKIIY